MFRDPGLRSLLLCLALLAASCGDTASTTSTAVPATTSAALTTTTLAPATTTTVAATTTLPGEPFDIVFEAGSHLTVIGVAHDDELNVRTGPGVEFDIVTSLAPLSDSAISLGEGRLREGSIWYALTADGVPGWVNSSFVAVAGATGDSTSNVVAQLGTIPVAADMAELGMIVAALFVSDEPGSTVTMVAAPTVGDLGEVTYDVVGLGDDAVRGLRLHVFGQPVDGGFSLKSVEETALCGRGVTDDGLCV